MWRWTPWQTFSIIIDILTIIQFGIRAMILHLQSLPTFLCLYLHLLNWLISTFTIQTPIIIPDSLPPLTHSFRLYNSLDNGSTTPILLENWASPSLYCTLYSKGSTSTDSYPLIPYYGIHYSVPSSLSSSPVLVYQIWSTGEIGHL